MTDRPGRSTSDLAPSVTLNMLDAVAENAEVSQRDLARSLGIALGLVNAYLRRCVNKGWIKVRQVPANRYAYYLTPQGFSEKARLTTEYLTYSFSYFRRARSECERLYGLAAERGLTRLALAGQGDLADIAIICRPDPLVLVAILDTAGERGSAAPRSHGGLMVVGGLDGLAVDGVMLTDLAAPQATFDRLAADWPAERLLLPNMLRIVPRGAPRRSPDEVPHHA